MKCFNHRATDAIGLCKHCSKALCAECCSDLRDGLACKNSHEEAVKQLNSLIDNNKKIYEAQPRSSLIMPLFYMFMGLVFLFFGFKNGQESYTLLLGSGFVICGLIMLISNSKLLKKITTRYED